MILPLIGQISPVQIFGLVLLATPFFAFGVTVLVGRRGIDDPDARAERYRDRFNWLHMHFTEAEIGSIHRRLVVALAIVGMFAVVFSVSVVLGPGPTKILNTRTVPQPPAVCNEHDGLVDCPPGVTWPPKMPGIGVEASPTVARWGPTGSSVVVDAGTWRMIGAFMVVIGVLDLILDRAVLARLGAPPRNHPRRTVILGTLCVVTGIAFFVGAEVLAQLWPPWRRRGLQSQHHSATAALDAPRTSQPSSTPSPCSMLDRTAERMDSILDRQAETG